MNSIAGQAGEPVAFRDVGLMALFMTALVLGFMLQRPLTIIAGTAMCAAYAYHRREDIPLRASHWRIAAVVALFFLPGFAKPYHGLSPIFYAFATGATFMAAWAAVGRPLAVLLWTFRAMYALAIAGIAWVLYTWWGYPEPFGMVIEGSSTNGIPAYLIVLQISLSLCTYLATGRLPLLTPVLTFAVAFFGNGRGSLVVAGLMIALTLLLNVLAPGRGARSNRLLFATAFAAAAWGLMLYGEDLLDLVTSYTKLSVGLVDTNRLEIWDHYSDKIDGLTLLLGADYAGTVIEYEYLGNPHIAYIRTHSFFGLPLTLLALCSPLLVLLFRKAWSARIVFLSFIGLAALRAASEPLFFPTLLDFFYFLWFQLYLRHAPHQAHAGLASLEPRHA